MPTPGIGGTGACGQGDHGQVLRQGVLCQPRLDLEAVEVGQMNVQQDDVRPQIAGQFQPLCPCLGNM